MLDIDRTYIGTPTEPVTLADAKIQCRVDFPDDDAYITWLITACRRRIEDYCMISIVPRTIVVNTDILKCNQFYELPYGPVTNAPVVTTLDSSNNISTLSATSFDYYVRGGKYKQFSIVNNVWGNAGITYTTGFTKVPEDLVLAIKAEIAFSYDNRGDSTNRYAAQDVGLSQRALELSGPFRRLAWL